MIYRLEKTFLQNYPLIVIDEIHHGKSADLIDGLIEVLEIKYSDIDIKKLRFSPKIVCDFILETAEKLVGVDHANLFEAIDRLSKQVKNGGYQVDIELKDYEVKLETDAIRDFRLGEDEPEDICNFLSIVYEAKAPTLEQLAGIVNRLVDDIIDSQKISEAISHLLDIGLTPDHLCWLNFSPDDIKQVIFDRKQKVYQKPINTFEKGEFL